MGTGGQGEGGNGVEEVEMGAGRRKSSEGEEEEKVEEKKGAALGERKRKKGGIKESPPSIQHPSHPWFVSS